MYYKTTFGALLLFFLSLNWGAAQPGFTANDQVRPYTEAFRYGSNFGNYPPWSNAQVANIAAGNEGLHGQGLGLKAHRPAMPEHFFEEWTYDVRIADFEHFKQLDIIENTAFIGYPSEAHRDNAMHCPDMQSEVFANLYEPIWDNGAGGTPVNDNNYFALYIYKMVNRYKEYVRFWEVWNEPDFSTNAITWAPPGEPGNWWENNPEPCDNALYAPIFHYIRMLRISYEVIKSIDEDAYICTGGLGNPAFLDAILRNTDNPDNGYVTDEYPLLGGAYFDVLSYHAYPHIDGSMLEWVNGVGLVWHRHSDRGVEGMVARKEAFQNVLDNYGYTGDPYPEKLWVLSETNLPREVYQQYIGTVESQRNYMIKSLVEAQKQDILQVDVFTISELENETNAWNEYQLMGLFENLSDYSYPNHQITDAGIAFKTTSDLLYGKSYDAAKTADMQMPVGVNGAAFSNGSDYVYVLWAMTSEDNSEAASASYSFPMTFNLDEIAIAQWNYGMSRDTFHRSPLNIPLTGAPVFLAEEFVEGQPVDTEEALATQPVFELFPNPFADQLELKFELPKAQAISITLFSADGKKIETLLSEQSLRAGPHKRDFDLAHLPDGVYWLSVQTEINRFTRRVIAQ